MHLMLLLWVLRGRASESAHCGGQARGHSRRGSARASTASTTRANALVTPWLRSCCPVGFAARFVGVPDGSFTRQPEPAPATGRCARPLRKAGSRPRRRPRELRPKTAIASAFEAPTPEPISAAPL